MITEKGEISARVLKPAARQKLKAKLIFATEKVVAHRGFSGATVREIHEVAGTKNASAIYYHFGSLEGVMEAVFALRAGPLDIPHKGARPTAEEIVNAFVRALAEFLTPRPEGNYYLRFLERTSVETDLVRTLVPSAVLSVWENAEDMLKDVLSTSAPAEILDLKITFSRNYFISALAKMEIWISDNPTSQKYIPLWTQTVIDSALAMLLSETSAPLMQCIDALKNQPRT